MPPPCSTTIALDPEFDPRQGVDLPPIRPLSCGRDCDLGGSANELVEPVCLRIVQIARQAERVAADVYVLLQHVGALFGIADNADAGSRPCFGKAGPEVRCNPIAHGRASSCTR